MKKICFISGSRADYGLLSNLMKLVKRDKKLSFNLIVTGSHLSKTHGHTYQEILKDKFNINDKIDLKINGDKPRDICRYISLAVKKISKKIVKLKPDLIILLGDRYEIFSAGIVALIHQIPICHLHGGEITEGSIDDVFRHSITKMSALHFVSNLEYKKRVRQLGENPKNIFVVGGFGVDLIKNSKLISKKKIETNLNLEFKKKNLLVTYHPETTNRDNLIKDFTEILKSLKKFKDIKVIFTNANTDVGGNIINKMINKFIKENKNRSCKISSMGQINYLSTLKYVDCILGNSSSGILEAPTLRTPTINIGDRQKGRLKAKSIIDVSAKSGDVIKAIKKIYSKKFNKMLSVSNNPYGSGNASIKTLNILKKINFEKLNKKNFFDLRK